MTINSMNNTASSLAVGNISISATPNQITTTDTNGNLILVPDGAGLINMYNQYTLPAVDGTAGYVMQTNGSGVVSWQPDVNSSFLWNVNASGPVTILVENGYIANNAAANVAYTLPSTATVGQVFEVAAGKSSFGFTIAQSAGQSVIIGSTTTTVGATGSLASTGLGDWIRFVCVTANDTFIASIQQGNITAV